MEINFVKIIIAILFSSLVVVACEGQVNYFDPTKEDSSFWAVKYSAVYEYTGEVELPPNLNKAISENSYYIQYGDSIVIEISDPGNEIEIVPIRIRTYNFSQNRVESKMLLDHVQRYYMRTSPIDTVREVLIEPLCNTSEPDIICDSFLITKPWAKVNYIITINPEISNLPFSDLFYPTIKHLPKSLLRVSAQSRPKVLDAIYQGRAAVESILEAYEREGYILITDEELEHAPEIPKELIPLITPNK